MRRCQTSPRLFQLRVRIGPLKNDSVNFGLYPSVSEAARVAKLVRQMLVRGVYIWAILEALKVSGDVPLRTLPRWVYRRPDGLFGARIRGGKHAGAELRVPQPTPTLAHDELRKQLGLPPLGPRVKTG